MRTLGRLVLSLTLLLVCAWLVVSAVEAEKEIRTLCAGFLPGDDLDDVTRALNTGEYLRFETVGEEERRRLMVDSRYNLRTTTCSVLAVNEVVVSSEYAESMAIPAVAAWVAAFGFVGLAGLQLLLAAGLPLGRVAWGGRHERLPQSRRVASFLSALVFLFGVVCVLEQGRLLVLLGMTSVVEAALTLLTVVLALSTLLNALSQSRLEYRLMTPVALVLTCACLAVLLGG